VRFRFRFRFSPTPRFQHSIASPFKN
jgi:hypothetical protein